MYVYLYVTTDKYELPLAIADSVEALARLVGVKPTSISQMMSRYKKNGWKCPYIKVKI